MHSLEDRIQNLIDGTLSPLEFKRLENELLANPEARRIYYSYMVMHQGLEYRLSRNHSKGNSGLANLAAARLKRQRMKAWKTALFSAAALILLTVVGMQMYSIQWNDRSRIEVAIAPGTLFELRHADQSLETESLFMDVNSRLQLTQGSVELEFASGVRSVIIGPADITLHATDKLFMDHGTGWFDVPRGAEGFTVLTREMEIVDLGTQFGVLSAKNANDEVHVFKGKVAVRAINGLANTMELTESQASKVKYSGRFEKQAINPSLFLSELPKSLPFHHWSFDDSENLIAENQSISARNLKYSIHKAPSNRAKSSPGVHGKALKLDGETDFIETDWDGITGDAPRSVSFWIKLPRRELQTFSENQKTIVGWGKQTSAGAVNTNNKWTIHLDPSRNRYPMLNISFGCFWYYCPEVVLDDGEWHHFAVIFHGKFNQDMEPDTQLFMDGNEMKLRPAFHDPIHRNFQGNVQIDTQKRTPMLIGAGLGGKLEHSIKEGPYLEAEIDELFIIEGAISHKEVENLHQHNTLTSP